jgi:hypothetical protein
MNVEMSNSVTVNSLLMKSLESATREYARKCVSELALEYGFSEEEALKKLKLENLKLQVQEMKKRSGGKAKAKAEKAEKAEKPKKIEKALFPLPFSHSNVLENVCQGLAYNGGLFTQCPKSCMTSLKYCKTCQSEIDKNGATTNGTVMQRLSSELMEFKDPRGRKPVAYVKIMDKHKVNREQVEAEAGKLNIMIDEKHFVVEEKKEKKEKKKVEKEDKEDDLLVQLLDNLGLGDEDEDAVDFANFGEALKQADEKARQAAKEKALKQDEEIVRKQADEKAAEVALKKQQQETEKAEKARKQADDKAAKEAEVALKKQQQADEKAAEVALKKQQQADEKAAKEAEVALKKQQQADEKAAKAQQIAEEKAAKAQQIAEEKAAKAQQIADEKAAKAQQIAEEKAAKKQQEEGIKKLKEHEKKATTPEKKSKEAAPKEKKQKEAEPVAEPEVTSAPAKKVTVKRITIEGKQYLKTAENLLYNPETKEEMGIYDPETNTIKELPDDSEDELNEDEMSDDE